MHIFSVAVLITITSGRIHSYIEDNSIELGDGFFSFHEWNDDSLWDLVTITNEMAQKCLWTDNSLLCACQYQYNHRYYLCDHDTFNAEQITDEYYVYDNHQQDLEELNLSDGQIYPERPLKPANQKEKISYPQLSYHHIIPWSTIKAFWNKVMRSRPVARTATSIPIFRLQLLKPLINAVWVAANRNAYDWGVTDIAIKQNHNARVKNLAKHLEELADGEETDAISDSDYWRDFVLALQWLPGNLFTGPRPEWRARDPRDRFEEFCEPIITTKYDRFKTINRGMESIIRGPIELNQATILTIQDVVKQYAGLVGQNSNFKFDLDQWSENRRGKWSINQPVERTLGSTQQRRPGTQKKSAITSASATISAASSKRGKKVSSQSRTNAKSRSGRQTSKKSTKSKNTANRRK